MANSFVTVGMKFPEFSKKSVVSIEKGKEFKDVGNKDIEGRWAVMFWWPKDFTFVCPTEIAEFNTNYTNFTDRDTVLLGASTDSEYVHHAWRLDHKDLRDLKFPMIADTSKSLSEELGILSADEKVAYRATYIIDPEGIVRWVCRPQRSRSTPRTRCPANRRALPLQLEQRRRNTELITNNQ